MAVRSRTVLSIVLLLASESVGFAPSLRAPHPLRDGRPLQPLRDGRRSRGSAFGLVPARAEADDSDASAPPSAAAPSLRRRARDVVNRVPDALTALRVLAVPVVVGMSAAGCRPALVAYVFAGAAATDWLDGALARLLKCSTPFGAFFDPVADKLMVCATLCTLCSYAAVGPLVAPAAALIVSREIAVSALREWMATAGVREEVKVSNVGKAKTATQMAAIFALLYAGPAPSSVAAAGVLGLWVSAGLAVWSGGVYFRAAWPRLSAARPAGAEAGEAGDGDEA